MHLEQGVSWYALEHMSNSCLTRTRGSFVGAWHFDERTKERWEVAVVVSVFFVGQMFFDSSMGLTNCQPAEHPTYKRGWIGREHKSAM